MDVEAEQAIFNLLVKALEANKDVHLHIVWGTMAFLIAAIGWLLTSENARDFIANHDIIKNIGVGSISLLAAAHFCMLYATYHQSKILVQAIKSNRYYSTILKNELVYNSFELSFWQVLLRSIFTLILFSLLIYLICWLKNLKAALP